MPDRRAGELLVGTPLCGAVASNRSLLLGLILAWSCRSPTGARLRRMTASIRAFDCLNPRLLSAQPWELLLPAGTRADDVQTAGTGQKGLEMCRCVARTAMVLICSQRHGVCPCARGTDAVGRSSMWPTATSPTSTCGPNPPSRWTRRSLNSCSSARTVI